MKFGNIHYLWILWIIPGVAIFYIWGFKRKKYLIEKFVASELKERLLEGVSISRQKLKAFLLLIGFSFLVVALIRPKWGYHWEEVKRSGVDIIVALDVSKSMLAQDISPNRLERAKRKIIDLLDVVEGDRIGLIAFAGVSFLQTPLTLDYGAVKIFLDDLDTDLIPVPGTAIGESIRTAIKSFSQKDKKSRVLILITDGEDHAEDPVKVAEEAAKEGIRIYTIGIGKEGGAPIPAEEGGFKKDSNGEMILTQMDEEKLQKIALATGGSYVRSVTGDLDLEKIYKDIKKNVEEKELKSGKRKIYEERFQWPLLIALLFFLMEPFISERKRKKSKNKNLLFSIVTFLFLISLFQANLTYAFLKDNASQGQEFYEKGEYDKALQKYLDAQIENPKNDELKYNLGNTYYKMGEYEKASKLFSSVAQSDKPDLVQKSYYNLGNTAYRAGKLKESLTFYQKALALNSEDQDAKKNLEFVQNEIKRRIEEQKKRQQQQKQQKKNSSCNNPGADKNKQQEDQQKQEQNKQEQQQNQQGQQGQQDQQKKEQKEKEKEKEKGSEQQPNKNESEQKRKEQKQQQQMGAKEKKDQDKQKKGSSGQANKVKGQQSKNMSEAEAQRWLSTLKDARKKYLKKRLQNSGQNFRSDKDW